jgi:thioredoxin reductase (NADPH)
MSTWPVPSALDATTQIFPLLTDAQINRVRNIGKIRNVKRDEVLFEPGDTGVPFFVILSGAMEIVQPGLDNERVITQHHPSVAWSAGG